MNYFELTPEQLLGPLTEVEQKFAPKQFFAAGFVGLVQEAARVSIVGSRKASTPGLARARKLASLLAGRGIVVVSGLAEGIDTAAHTACIESGGHTVAVLGTPLDQVYPRQNATLQEKIMREHLCLSQFARGQTVQRGNFPMRNLTMVLISDACVIVDAGQSSGCIGFGWEALRLGRPLFITKALASKPSLQWPAEMIKYGASILSDENIEVFFELFPERCGRASIGESFPGPAVIDAVRGKIQVGLDQLDRGEGIPGDRVLEDLMAYSANYRRSKA